MNVDRQRILDHLFWDDRAFEVAAYWGLDEEAVRGIIRAGAVSPDPHSADAGHPIARFTSGDVVVVVGLRDPDRPKVMHVHTTTETPGRDRMAPSAGRIAGTGPGSSLPTSHRDLKRRIIALGYRFEVTGSGHLGVVSKKTGRRITTVSSTPKTSRTTADDWKRFLRAHNQEA